MHPEQTAAGDLLEIEPQLMRASTGQRFVNYLIDVIVFYLLFIGLGVIIALVSPAAIDSFTEESDGFGLLERLFSLIFYALYMGLVEGVLKGKSLGKLISGTRAVNLDGSRISFSKAFARGFSRAVPFCVFSAFGTPCDPWQDRWTDTMVIDEKTSNN